MKRITLIAFAMALMFSPDFLSLMGNSVGTAGICFLLVLLTAIIIHLFTAFSYGDIFNVFPGSGGEVRYVEKALGSVPVIIFPVCSRVVFTVFAATGILASAGYIFNEIFVYWFPNLAFSFCLLGLLLLIDLLGKKVVFAAQVIFVAVAFSGLLFLSLWGLISGGDTTITAADSERVPFNLFRLGAMGLVLFIGFDLAGAVSGEEEHRRNNMAKLMAIAIISGGVLLALWGLVSYIYVSPQRLMDSSVPYSHAARAVLGMTGRKIMGLVVLAGCCGAINALLSGVSGIIAATLFRNIRQSFSGVWDKRRFIPLIFLSLFIALMLAMGMAGEPRLEVYTRGSIYFWLLNYGVVHLSVLIMGKREGRRSESFPMSAYPVLPSLGLAAICACVSGLVWFDAETALVLKFMAVAVAAAFFLGLVWMGITSRKSSTMP